MSEYEQAVFISYAWGAERENIVNEIDETLQQRGIRIVRDKRALGYRGSIKEFMERIGQGRCVIVVISDKYLRSPNCMFELVEIAENKQFHDRVFPVVLSDANIYDPLKRIEYVKYWEAKRKELAKAMKTLDPANLQGIRDDMDQYDRIRDQISGITSILKDMNTLTPDVHRDSEFSNLYDAIVRRLEESATDVTTEFNNLAQKSEDERREKEAERLAQEKSDGERIAKEEANRLVTQKAEEERIAQERVQAEYKAREEAEHLAAQKAETERIAQEKAEGERLAQLKAQEELKAKEEVNRLAAQEAEAERIAQEKAQAEPMPAGAKAAFVSNQPAKKKPLHMGLLIGGIAAMIVCLIAGAIVFNVFSNKATPANEAPIIPDTGDSSLTGEIPATDAPVVDSNTSTPAPLAPTQCSINSSETLSVNFVNNSDVKLDGYWVDESCNAQYYFSIDPGQTLLEDTYVGHVWRFVDPENDNLHLEYVAQSGDTEVSVP